MIFSIGLLIPGFGYLVTTGNINQDGFIFFVPLMLYGLAFILIVELPDMESDRLGRKMTWVAQKGRIFGLTLIAASFLFATLFFLFFPLLTSRNYPVNFLFLGVLSLLPLGAGCIGLLKRPSEKPLVTQVVNGIMITLAVFLILVDGYVVSLAFSQML